MSQIQQNTVLLQELLDDMNGLSKHLFLKRIEGIDNMNIRAVELGDITQITAHAFYACYNLIAIEIPASVKTIGYQAFGNCENLIAVELTLGLEVIDSSAFSGCSALTSIAIPASVTNIDTLAFSYCLALERVIINAQTPPTVGGVPFSNCNALTKIIVPVGCVDAYKNADGWSDYADLIVEATE